MNKKFVEITNKALSNKIWEFLGTNDIFALDIDMTRYYIYCSNTEIPLSIRIMKGIDGLKSLTSLFEFDDEPKNELENFESFMTLNCMELNLFLPVDMDEATKAEILNQGFEIDENSYNPLYSVAEKNTLRRNLIDEEEVVFGKILEALIKSKTYFSKFGKISATTTFQPWFDSLNLEDSDKIDYIPCAKIDNESISFSPEPFDWFDLAPKKDNDPVIEVPSVLVEEVKKEKKNYGEVFDFTIYLLPAPYTTKEGGKPQYPYCFLLRNIKTMEIVDLKLGFHLENEMKAYPLIILDLFAKNHRPDAIHTYGSRSFNYLKGVLKGTDIKIIKDDADDKYMDFALQLPHLLQNGGQPVVKAEDKEEHSCSCGDPHGEGNVGGGCCGHHDENHVCKCDNQEKEEDTIKKDEESLVDYGKNGGSCEGGSCCC
ncbi:MAG: hypothetical protein JJE21_01660 [Spirochaetaceae bacterium]|nr:hypothetical protein [Spirochaetaceae bacterium]